MVVFIYKLLIFSIRVVSDNGFCHFYIKNFVELFPIFKIRAFKRRRFFKIQIIFDLLKIRLSCLIIASLLRWFDSRARNCIRLTQTLLLIKIQHGRNRALPKRMTHRHFQIIIDDSLVFKFYFLLRGMHIYINPRRVNFNKNIVRRK